ncbi:MAG: S8 family serine peptidase [Candidatus Hydrogenedentes bacterium]|nr:S8 family serine peptidase [Candidatus Hydrogenedentota bacterium]
MQNVFVRFTVVLILGGTTLFLAAGQVPVTPPSDFADLDGAAYRGWKGQFDYLPISKQKVGITFRQGLNAAQKQGLVQAITHGRPSASVLDPTFLNQSRTVVVDLVQGLARSEVANTVRALRSQAEVYRVHPVFESAPGMEELLTDYLYVSVPADTPEETVQPVFQANGVEVMEKVDYSLIGKVGYRLRVAQAVYENALNSLIIANGLYDHPLTTEAAPYFTPLYSEEQSVNPNDTLYTQNRQWHLAKINAPDAWGKVYEDQYGVFPLPFVDANADGWPDAIPEIVIAAMDDGVMLDYDRSDVRAFTISNFAVKAFSESFTGTNAGHEDLNPNQWINLAEVNGVDWQDDDGNGYVDDYFGWDFVGKNYTNLWADESPYWDAGHKDGDGIPFPDVITEGVLNRNRGHGTGGISIAAARGNNGIGLAGVCWYAKIMPVRIHVNTYYPHPLGENIGFAARAADGLLYATETGAHICELTMARGIYDPDVYDAIKTARAYGCVIIVPAGNNGQSLDAHPIYPAVYPEVITVGATGSTDGRAVWGWNDLGFFTAANFGACLDVTAPTKSYLSWSSVDDPFPDASDGDVPSGDGDIEYNEYNLNSGQGTSSSFPQVAGLAALLLTVDPAFSPAEIQAFMAWSAHDANYSREMGSDGTISYDQTPGTGAWTENAEAGRDVYTGWGRIDASAAVDLAKKMRFAISNKDGRHIASWDQDGNFILDCKLKEHASSTELDYTDLTTPNNPEFVIRHGTADGGWGQKVARLDPDDDNGRPVLYLKGEIKSTWVYPSSTASEFIIQKYIDDAHIPAVAYINSNGDMYLTGRVFIATDPDPFEADIQITVGPPNAGMTFDFTMEDEDGDRYEDEGSQAIQDAINSVSTNPVQYRVIIVYPVFDASGQALETLYNPFNFAGREVVVQSPEPENREMVRAVVIAGQGLYGESVVEFGGSETVRAALKGVTVKNSGSNGIYGHQTKASILNNIVQFNGSDGVSYCSGLIQMNVIEHNSGAGLTYCHNATIINNILRYNAQGGVRDCHDTRLMPPDPGDEATYYSSQIVAGNLIYCNRSGYGGGLDLVSLPIQNNLIFFNSALYYGGGLYQCSGHIEHNTVFHNTAPSGGGMYSCTGTDQVIRSNIVWANTPDQIVNSTAPEYSCIQGWSITDSNSDGYDDVNGNTNLDPQFISTAINQGVPWHEFLHLYYLDTSHHSPCIDRGYIRGPRSAVVGDYDEDDVPDNDNRDHRDVDDQPTFIDIPGVFYAYNKDPGNLVLPYDMGADEYPSPAEFTYWWDLLGETTVTIYIALCPGCN